jgi:hypothetical protein
MIDTDQIRAFVLEIEWQYPQTAKSLLELCDELEALRKQNESIQIHIKDLKKKMGE